MTTDQNPDPDGQIDRRAERGPRDPIRTDNERIDETDDESVPAGDPSAAGSVVGTGAPAPDDESEDGSEAERRAAEQEREGG